MRDYSVFLSRLNINRCSFKDVLWFTWEVLTGSSQTLVLVQNILLTLKHSNDFHEHKLDSREKDLTHSEPGKCVCSADWDFYCPLYKSVWEFAHENIQFALGLCRNRMLICKQRRCSEACGWFVSERPGLLSVMGSRATVLWCNTTATVFSFSNK